MSEYGADYKFVILEKIKSTHQRLRSDRIDGIAPGVPKVGECFYMGSSPIDPSADMRLVRTSPVKKVESKKGPIKTIYDFETENSTYCLTVYDFFG
jgi:hypothetical protein